MFASGPEDHFEAARPAEVVQPETSQEGRALEEAVHRTLANTESGGPVTREEITALQAVAARHGDVPLTLDPIAIELVEAIINVNYGHLRRPREVWQRTAAKIARLLCDSPEARARLENLWRRLVEST